MSQGEMVGNIALLFPSYGILPSSLSSHSSFELSFLTEIAPHALHFFSFSYVSSCSVTDML